MATAKPSNPEKQDSDNNPAKTENKNLPASDCFVFRISGNNLAPVGSEPFSSPESAIEALKKGKQKGVFVLLPAVKIS